MTLSEYRMTEEDGLEDKDITKDRELSCCYYITVRRSKGNEARAILFCFCLYIPNNC
jgi:hypothetical protein